MKFFLIIILSTVMTVSASAQTYYYLESMEISPDSPSTQDEISVHVYGSFSSSGGFMIGHSVTIEAGQVYLNIDCADNGGAAVITPFDTLLYMGQGLAAGDYNIILGGFGLGDFVTESGDYDFSVVGANSITELSSQSIHTSVAANQLKIEYPGAPQPLSYCVIDITGRQVKPWLRVEQASYQTDLSAYTPGTYLLQIQVDDLILTRRISLR